MGASVSGVAPSESVSNGAVALGAEVMVSMIGEDDGVSVNTTPSLTVVDGCDVEATGAPSGDNGEDGTSFTASASPGIEEGCSVMMLPTG